MNFKFLTHEQYKQELAELAKKSLDKRFKKSERIEFEQKYEILADEYIKFCDAEGD